ncbi:MAG: hypothetical protein CME24_13200 [Gemmatimonadetes bacterium]|nr:hypothetical protein [Gemmatimonadota bacterium]
MLDLGDGLIGDLPIEAVLVLVGDEQIAILGDEAQGQQGRFALDAHVDLAGDFAGFVAGDLLT